MQIKITLVSGEVISLNVLATDKIGDVKKKLEEMKHIYVGNKKVMFNGMEMSIEERLCENGITNGSMLKMFEQSSKNDELQGI